MALKIKIENEKKDWCRMQQKKPHRAIQVSWVRRLLNVSRIACIALFLWGCSTIKPVKVWSYNANLKQFFPSIPENIVICIEPQTIQDLLFRIDDLEAQ